VIISSNPVRDSSTDDIPDPIVDHLAGEEAAKRGLTRRVVSDDEIIARITALANAGAGAVFNFKIAVVIQHAGLLL
jgi:hypothetical protein